MYMSHKAEKLELQARDAAASEASTAPGMFAGVRAFITGRVDPPLDELKYLLHVHGGRSTHWYAKGAVSHIVAAWLPDTKVKELLKEKNPVPAVAPAWVTDSIAAGHRLPEAPYLLAPFRRSAGQALDQLLQRGGPAAPCAPQSEPGQVLGETGVVALAAPAAAPAAAAAPPTPHPSSAVASAKNAPSRPASTEEDPDFIQHYFSTSRLHFLGTFRDHAASLVRCFPVLPNTRRAARPGEPGVTIAHVDMDCFFVAVALLARPTLRGAPVAVAHCSADAADPATASAAARANIQGEVSSASYEARAAGVHAGMHLQQAVAACPGLTIVPYDFAAIGACSKLVYATLTAFSAAAAHAAAKASGVAAQPWSLAHLRALRRGISPTQSHQELVLQVRAYLASRPQFPPWLGRVRAVEPMSCDEAYVDVSGVQPVEAMLSVLRAAVAEVSGCPASAGAGPSRMLAKLATSSAKPNGQALAPGSRAECEAYMAQLPVKSVPGVGWRIARQLRELNITTCAQLQAVERLQLQAWFGSKAGDAMYGAARGQAVNEAAVGSQKPRKSVGVEITWGVRFSSDTAIRAFVDKLAQEVMRRAAEALLHDTVKAAHEGAMSPGASGRVALLCRHVTVKVKQRTPGAGRPGKNLGHGACDNMSKSRLLAEPAQLSAPAPVLLGERITLAQLAVSSYYQPEGRTSGADAAEFVALVEQLEVQAAALSQVAWSLYSALHVPAKELRGIGIQLAKLSLVHDGELLLGEQAGASSGGLPTSAASASSMLTQFFKPAAVSTRAAAAAAAGSSCGQLGLVDAVVEQLSASPVGALAAPAAPHPPAELSDADSLASTVSHMSPIAVAASAVGSSRPIQRDPTLVDLVSPTQASEDAVVVIDDSQCSASPVLVQDMDQAGARVQTSLRDWAQLWTVQRSSVAAGAAPRQSGHGATSSLATAQASAAQRALLSLSQVDGSVMAELPPAIALDVVRTLSSATSSSLHGKRQLSRGAAALSTSSPAACSSPAGPSSIQQPEPPSPMPEASIYSAEVFSQLTDYPNLAPAVPRTSLGTVDMRWWHATLRAWLEADAQELAGNTGVRTVRSRVRQRRHVVCLAVANMVCV